MQAMSLERSSIAQNAVVLLATLSALVVLGWVLAQWTWAWLAPRPEPRTPAAVPAGLRLQAAPSLFGVAQRGGNVAAPTGIAIRLLGVIAANGGHLGYAVVQLEARQILAVREGDDIAPGIRLAEVGTDHVILERGGVRETLAWLGKNAAAQSATLPNP